jgi:hypothetical protein
MPQCEEEPSPIFQYWATGIVRASTAHNHSWLVDKGYYSPWYTLLLPLRIMPYTDGRSWARRNGLTGHRGVQEGEELTDEEDDPPA